MTVPLTPAGRAALLGAVTLCVAGQGLGYPAAFGIGVAGLVLVLGAGLTVAVKPKLALSRTFEPDRVSVGEPAAGLLHAHNKGRRAVAGLVVVDRVGDEPVEVPLAAIQASGWRTAAYSIPTQRRGRLNLGPLTVERRDAFGFFRRSQPMGEAGTLWVHPRVHEVQPMPVGSVPDFEGRAEASKAGTTSFSSLREYVPGDDPRRIHWRSTARTGQLVVRESVDTMEPTVTVVLDARPSAFGADLFEEAVEVAATVVVSTVEGGRPARLTILGEDEAAVAAEGATTPLDRLAAARQCADSTPTALLSSVDVAEPGGALVVITGADEPGVVARLAEQRRRFTPVVVVTMSATSSATHRSQGVVVLGARTGAEAAGSWNHLVLGGAVS
ncbi:DUF58 domain-containing protein [Lentzea terrae]|uniref:DUF58 domain-containing protein n=1 Tax=Lentzea terrae TaxID=2200761 RepID=UPI001E4FF4C3|nr:DUF58 domain-containing protein [Lentzea terrae]